jgi:hypothetical protein
MNSRQAAVWYLMLAIGLAVIVITRWAGCAPPAEWRVERVAMEAVTIEEHEPPPYANVTFDIDPLVGDVDGNGIVLAMDLAMAWSNRGARVEDQGGTLTAWTRPGIGSCSDYLPHATVYAEPMDPNHPALIGVSDSNGYWRTQTPPRWRLRWVTVEEAE